MKRIFLAITTLAFIGCATGLDDLTLSGDLVVGDDTTFTDDVDVGGDLTVTGTQTFTGALAANGGITMQDDDDLVAGTGSDFVVTFDATAQAPDSALIGLGSESRQLVICETADVATDLTIAQQTDPTLLIHSADATDAADYVTLAHNQTNGVLDVGQGVVSIPDGVSVLADDKQICLGASTDACFEYETAQTVDTLALGLSTDSRSLLVIDKADIATDFGHAQQTNPTIYIQSADQATVADWISLAHDQTDALIATGAGDLNLQPAVGIQVTSATLTSGGTDDRGVEILQTLNDAGAAGGSDLYNGLKMLITETDVTGWDTVNLMDLATDSGTMFRVNNAGVTTVAGNIAANGGATMGDNDDLVCGDGSDFLISFDAAAQDPDSAFIGLGSESRQLVIAETADIGTDLTLAQSTDPKLVIHSADATDANDWISFEHNQTNGVIDIGQGIVSIPDDISLKNAETVTNATDGEVCITGVGGSNNENICFDAETTANEVAVTTDTGVTRVDYGSIGVKTSIPLMMLSDARFCGQGANGATDNYIGPQVQADMDTDLTYGGAGCDGKDDTTEATADLVLHPGMDMDVVGMVCVIDDGQSGDTASFTLRDDTSSTSLTCTTATLDSTGFDQCSVILDAPVTIAAGSAIAILAEMSGTDDCSGCDVECHVYYTF
jgi:hypothetical protein